MFDVQQYVADKKVEPYTFKDINGDPQELPNLVLVTSGEADRLMGKLDSDPVGALKEIRPDLVSVFEATPLLAIRPLVADYIAHCAASVGESEASSGSSKSTARPSRSTSRGSTPAKTRKR